MIITLEHDVTRCEVLKIFTSHDCRHVGERGKWRGGNLLVGRGSGAGIRDGDTKNFSCSLDNMIFRATGNGGMIVGRRPPPLIFRIWAAFDGIIGDVGGGVCGELLPVPVAGDDRQIPFSPPSTSPLSLQRSLLCRVG